MKRILGLDLGPNSIGWALVDEAETPTERSSIVKLGVRVNPLTVDELTNFEKGKSITTNSERTLRRGMRRNLQRYRQRREALVSVLRRNGFIDDDTLLSEQGNRTTFETYRLRAKAATEEVTLRELARVLLMINKKRGYKSSRKAKNNDEGALIDGMDIARKLYDEQLTPGQLCLELTEAGRKVMPDFYRSDLQAEFDRIWQTQRAFYPELLTDALKEELRGKNGKAVWAICAKAFVWKETHDEWDDEEARTVQVEREHRLTGIHAKRKPADARRGNLQWRERGLRERLSPEELVVVMQDIGSQIARSSGYLGAISDRSKELYFTHRTVGQYQMDILARDPNASLRNMVFYRQDYLDEFDRIWETQARFHPELTDELKREVRDIVIFYQRRLKSQKGRIGFCEFESRQIEVEIEGRKKLRTTGSRVIPRSSPLFQEFKIWHTINNIVVGPAGGAGNGSRPLSLEEKLRLAGELSVRGKMTKAEVLKLLFANPRELDLNFDELEGNLTRHALMQAFSRMMELTGHDPIDFKRPAADIEAQVGEVFAALGWNTDILAYDPADDPDRQPAYRLWHRLYSFEGDDTAVGNGRLVRKLQDTYGFDKDSARLLANVTFKDDYGSLSAKAIRRILPHLKEGMLYSDACEAAGYRHSKASLTKDEIRDKVLRDRLDVLPKNSLRNPVVEKILNQLVHVVNGVIDTYGRPDEVRVELARELKKSAKEREETTKAIADNTKENEACRKLLEKEFGLRHVGRNDILRYRLYKELEPRGFKTLYSDTYIAHEKLFSGEFDIEHIIPQARLFDDSFSNKTLEVRSVNIDKANATALDFVKARYGASGLARYQESVDALFKAKKISKAKRGKLLMTEQDIPEGFIERDLRTTQYITRKALEMLGEVARTVVATTGSVTDRLRQDWGLVDMMKELNWEKYKALGQVDYFQDRDGRQIGRIIDWTKRNDHRHHAMDALTVAFTRQVFVQYFNNKNASLTPNTNEQRIRDKYFAGGKALPPMPLDELRAEARKQMENILVSIKSKNKVVTNNVNRTWKRGGVNTCVQQTPRGPLHLETIYGRRRRYLTKDERVNAAFDRDKIATVGRQDYRRALAARLEAHGGDPKKAFTGKNALDKNSIWLDEGHTRCVPERVRTVALDEYFTIRKDVAPDLKLDKVVDAGIRRILTARLEACGGDAQKAFSNLDENPVWLDRERGIAIKRVTITGIGQGQALHTKRDKEGRIMHDKEGREVPVDFVNTGNNHHVAVYRRPVLDKKGQVVTDDDGQPRYEIEERVVSFFDAVTRRRLGLPVIDKDYRASEGWAFLFSMKQNEYFVFPNEATGFDPKEIDLLDERNYKQISPNLFRVQTISPKDYRFRHHLETMVKDSSLKMKDITWKRLRNPKELEPIVKVRVNHIGQIVGVGEY